MSESNSFKKLVMIALGLVAGVFPLAVFAMTGTTGHPVLFAQYKEILKFLNVATMFYYVIFMPLIAFMMILVVPFYVFRLKNLSNIVRVILLALIVATLVFITLQFLWLNSNIEFVRTLYQSPAIWIFSWLVHLAIVILIVAPLIYEEEPLFIALVLSLVLIIVSANYVGLKYLSLIKGMTKG